MVILCGDSVTYMVILYSDSVTYMVILYGGSVTYMVILYGGSVKKNLFKSTAAFWSRPEPSLSVVCNLFLDS